MCAYKKKHNKTSFFTIENKTIIYGIHKIKKIGAIAILIIAAWRN